jgi:hypothetical protein
MRPKSALPWLGWMPPCVAKPCRRKLLKQSSHLSRKPPQALRLWCTLKQWPRPKVLRLQTLQSPPLRLRQMNKPATRQLPMRHKQVPIRTACLQKSLRHPWLLPSPPNPWWRCAATTGLAKSVLKHQRAAMAAVMAALASAGRAPEVTGVQVLAALVTEVLNAGVIVLATVDRVKTAARVWVMRLSAPNAKPWSGPKCPCASWRHKRTARPWVE